MLIISNKVLVNGSKSIIQESWNSRSWIRHPEILQYATYKPLIWPGSYYLHVKIKYWIGTFRTGRSETRKTFVLRNSSFKWPLFKVYECDKAKCTRSKAKCTRRKTADRMSVSLDRFQLIEPGDIMEHNNPCRFFT